MHPGGSPKLTGQLERPCQIYGEENRGKQLTIDLSLYLYLITHTDTVDAELTCLYDDDVCDCILLPDLGLLKFTLWE